MNLLPESGNLALKPVRLGGRGFTLASVSTIAVKTFDMQVATGSKAATILLDEAHLLTHPDAPGIIGQLRGGQAAIPEGQMIIVTTMSDIPAAGYWKSELQKARDVRDGEVELAGYCPIIYELPPGIAKNEKAVCEPENWRKVNPNLDRSVSLDWLQTSFKEAESVGRSEKLRWLSQHANVEITGYSLGDDAWGGALLWHKGAAPEFTLDRIKREADMIACGIDGGGMDDLMALCVLGRIGDQWVAWVHCWVAEVALGRRLSIKSRLLDFAQDGDLTVCTPGEDLLDIAGIVAPIYREGKLAAVGIDPAGIGIDIAEAISAEGVPDSQVVNVPQGFKLNPSYTTIERRLEQGRLLHCNQPIMDWCVSNAKRSPAGLVTKAHSGIGKIDALVATACATLALILATFSSPSFAERPDWAKKAVEDIVTFAANASGGTDDLDADGADFDILIQALIYTGVIGIFDGTDYTVFAPNDQAFYNLTNTSDDTAALNAVLGLLSQEQIEGVLAYHVTDGVRNSRSVTRAKQLVMLDGNSISYMNNLIVANESEAGLLSIDNRLSDGMVHVIDTVLLAAPLPSP